MKIKKKIVKEVEIKRDLIQDGVGKVIQMKIIPKKDNEGLLVDEIRSGFMLHLDPEAILPKGYSNDRLTERDDAGNPVDLGRPVDVISGTITINLQVERAEVSKK